MNLIDKIINLLKNFDNQVILLIFSASWCGPCKKLKEKLKDENDPNVESIRNMKYVIFDVDDEDNEELCSIFKVGGIPHQVFVKLDENDKINVLHTIVGFNLEELIHTYNKLS